MSEARARLSLDSRPFSQGIDKAQSKLNTFATSGLSNVKSLLAGAFTVGAVVSLTKDSIELGSAFSDLSKRTGVSAEELQKLDFAAKQSGTDIQAVAEGLKKLALSMNEALSPNGEKMRKTFEDLGVSVHDLQTQSPDQIFKKIATAVKNSSDITKTKGDLVGVLGKNFDSLIPLLVEGADGLQKFGEQAEKLGLILSNLEVDRLEKLGDRMSEFKKRAEVAKARFLITGMDITDNIKAAFVQAGGSLRELVASKEDKPHVRAAVEKWLAEIGAENLGMDLTPKGPESSAKLNAFRRDEFLEKERERKLANEEKMFKKLNADARKFRLEEEAFNHQIGAEEAARVKEELEIQKAIADAKAGVGISVSSPLTDSLARIGGFVGSAGDPKLNVAERSLRTLEEIKEIMKRRDMYNDNVGHHQEIGDMPQ